MKRTLAIMFVIALSCALISGCSCLQGDCQKCTELCQAALDKAKTTEQTCSASLNASQGAATKADNAARRAEQAADRAESVLKQEMKK
ncbi:MAG: hypothetical protein ACLQVJ_07690 [Syntrophobacteraceae bacterium]